MKLDMKVLEIFFLFVNFIYSRKLLLEAVLICLVKEVKASRFTVLLVYWIGHIS